MVYRALVAPLQYAVLALGVVIVVLGGTHYVSAVHTAREASQRVCRAELTALLARNLFIEKFLRPSDPCLALQVVRGGS